MIFLKNVIQNFFLNVKKGFFFKKSHTFIILSILGFLIFLGLYRLTLILAVYSLIYLFFQGQEEKKVVSFQEILRLKYKSIVLNRKYLRIKRFWKIDFKIKYKKVKVYILVWQVPLLSLMSFYHALSTRYMWVSNIFYLRCCILFIVFKNPYGLVYMLAFLGVLFIISLLCAIPPINNSLKKTYGPNTLKKLGFNIWYSTFTPQGKIAMKTIAGCCVSVGVYEVGAEVGNNAINNLVANYTVHNYEASHKLWREWQAQGRNVGPEPVAPDLIEIYNRKYFPTGKSFIDIFRKK